MSYTPKQALRHAEEKRGDILYDLERAKERLAELEAELLETDGIIKTLRELTLIDDNYEE